LNTVSCVASGGHRAAVSSSWYSYFKHIRCT